MPFRNRKRSFDLHREVMGLSIPEVAMNKFMTVDRKT